MRPFATVVAIVFVCSVPGFAAENAPKIAQRPFYRPHYSARKATGVKPRASGATVIVNAASYEPGVSPGDLATIFGEDLTNVSGIVLAGTDPFPTRLGAVQVFVNGIAAPIYGIAYANGQDQISIQVPYETPVGPNAADIQVYNQGLIVADFASDSFTEDPGIFTYDNGLAIAQASDYSLIGRDNPAIPGEPLVLYVTGLGPLDQNLPDGYGAPTNPLANTIDPFRVILDNEDCTVFFSGLTPGLVGVYQINFYVPKDAASGNLQIYIQDAYTNSAVATLPVE